MAEYNSLEKVRLQKLEELRAEGVEAFPTRAERTHMSTEAYLRTLQFKRWNRFV
jgi:hypothetical protein